MTWREGHSILSFQLALPSTRATSQESSWEGPLIVAFDVSDDWSVTWRHVLAERSPTPTLTLIQTRRYMWASGRLSSREGISVQE